MFSGHSAIKMMTDDRKEKYALLGGRATVRSRAPSSRAPRGPSAHLCCFPARSSVLHAPLNCLVTCDKSFGREPEGSGHGTPPN